MDRKTVFIGKSEVSFSGDMKLSVEDLLLMACSSLRNEDKTREIAVTITELEKVIAYYKQYVVKEQ